MKPNTILEIENRKSVRAYLDKKIEPEIKESILSACLHAPTAGNMAFYSIIDITDSEVKEELSILCDQQPFIRSGKMVLVFIADPTRWYTLYQDYAPIKPTLADFYLGICDSLIAAQNAVIAAESYGIGSCYIGDIVENYEKVKALLELPKYTAPVCLLVFGYPTQQQKERIKPARFDISDLVHQNRYHALSKQEAFLMLKRRIQKHNPEYTDHNDELTEKTQAAILRQFTNKQNAQFFKEMNRSIKRYLEEYKEGS